MAKKVKLGRYDCPMCGQDMRAQPHEGINGHDCILCGQGINWRAAAKIKAAKRKK